MTQYRRRRVRNSGFTLIEALVAMVLMGMILSALATVTAQWLPSWNRGFARVQQSELMGVAVERIVADLAVAEFVPPNRKTKHPLFEGSELSVTFVRTAIGPNTRSGLEVVRIGETADRQGPVVVRSRAPFAPGTNSPDQLYFADPVVLLRAPYRISFSYAGRDRAWRATWRDAAQLPSAVRLAIRDLSTERVLAVSTVIKIHAELPAACAGETSAAVCEEPGSADAVGVNQAAGWADADHPGRTP